jgi:spore germination cell wall hydrolase CwlJ-like protein
MIDVMLFCLAWNGYFESRGEPEKGQRAVMEVTLRRADMSGRSICEEVFLDRQFSWTDRTTRPRVTNAKAWAQAVRLAHESMIAATDHSLGATHFHAKRVKPYWSKQLCHTVTIGNHVFYRPCS